MDKTISTKTGTHALLIGVDDYSTFESNGGSNLKGSRNDVVLLASYCMEVLGIQAENIHVLTTPKMSPEDFQKRMIPPEIEPNKSKSWLESLSRVTLGRATKANVKDGLDWLLAMSKESAGAALFAFSGHGAWSSKAGPLLCLDDTTQGFTDGVLALKDLGAAIAKARARHKLIALFDCCHVAASPRSSRLQGKALPHLGTSQHIVDDQDLFNVSDRVILGASLGKEAFQMRLGRWHGALTFALVTAAERWQGENEVSHGSYKHVLKRAKGTLKALGVPQNPEFWVAIRQSPFLGVKAGPTQREPDAAQEGAQLTPDFRYTINAINNESEVTIAWIFATTTTAVSVNGTSLLKNKESWYVDDGALANLDSADHITITTTKLETSYDIPSTFSQSFTSAESVDWTQSLPLPDGAKNYFFDGTSASTPSVNPMMWVVFSIPMSGDPSLTHVQWWVSKAPADGTFNPGDESGIRYAQSKTKPPTTDARAASR
jgi:hypothetical protein